VNRNDNLGYIWIPPGEFLMGSSAEDPNGYSDERPAHPVKLTKGFWICETPVTQAAYQLIRGENPSHFRSPDRPVERVDWFDAQEYCRRAGTRLPTEAEWEFAARGDTPSPALGPLEELAWFIGNSGGQTHAVGSRRPNPYGLYDTLGNVFEWVADWFASYTPDAEVDPQGPKSGRFRVLRGGSFDNTARMARVSSRIWALPTAKTHTMGFRCVADEI
jgi:formylglycine-generating enzyme required for sulfatase activity